MKQGLFLFIFVFAFNPFLKSQIYNPVAKDTTKKQNRWFIATYPSSIFLGDISAGLEFNHKRIRQEVALFYKCYTFLQNYLYENGYGINYYFKYNFINRENFLLSADIGYVFRKAFYENKAIAFGKDNFGLPINQYKTDRLFCKSGASLGLSSLIRLNSRFYVGVNACIDLVAVTDQLEIKEYVSGSKLTVPENPNLELPMPYNWERNGNGLSATFLIKLAYEL